MAEACLAMSSTHRPSWTSEHHWVGYSIIQVFSYWERGIISTDVTCGVVTEGAAGVRDGLVARLKTKEKSIVALHCTGKIVECFAAKSICFCVSVAEVVVELYLQDEPSLCCVQLLCKQHRVQSCSSERIFSINFISSTRFAKQTRRTDIALAALLHQRVGTFPLQRDAMLQAKVE